MFKAENTGTPAWKMVVDSKGKHIANLDELYNGDWGLTYRSSRDKIYEDSFSNASRAVSWLWKNRMILGEPFSLYEDIKKKSSVKEDKITIIEKEPEFREDLFWQLGKPIRKK